MNLLYDSLGDPRNSDIVSETPRIQSAYYSGNYPDIVAPTTPNYPPVTPTRYFIKLPVVPDTAQTIIVRDLTTSTVLTKVAGAPGSNQYYIAPSTSKTPDIIELHSGQAGHTIGFDYYGIGSIVHADDIFTDKREVTVAGTYVEFDDLNILPGPDVYDIFGTIDLSDTTAGSKLEFLVNEDVSAVYANQGFKQYGTSFYPESGATFRSGYLPAGLVNNVIIFHTVMIFYGSYVLFITTGGDGQNTCMWTTKYSGTISSITNLKFYLQTAEDIAVGSFIKIKKR